MARVNRCRVCGWTGEHPTREEQHWAPLQCVNIPKRWWVGTNHNLCNLCVPEKKSTSNPGSGLEAALYGLFGGMG